MIRKSIILAAAAALAVSLSGAAMAAPKATDTAPSAAALAKKSPAEIYDLNHKGAVGMLTEFKTVITTVPEVSGPLAQLSTELAKLPGLEKAFIDAKNAGNEADAKKAQDSYTASVQTIVDLAVPLDQGLMPVRAKIAGGFEAVGPIGAKLKAEKDVAGLLADIDAALKPLDDANAIVGPMHDAAMKTTQTRIKQEAKKIFSEELGAQVGNMLQAKLAQ
jgi:hypothetical protein